MLFRSLVTGGGGFLGSAIVRRLVARGDTVKTFQRGLYPLLEKLGVECIRGDLTDHVALRKAVHDVDVIFHVAAKAGVWGGYSDYVYPNFYATRFIAEFAFELGIKRLVYTSSPSVVFNGTDEAGADESVPYPEHYLAHYPQTKAIAERAVLKANGERFANGGELATVALRPHLIWGPGDNHLVPRLIERGRAGKLRRVGSGTNLVDTVYVDNAADAHLLAAQKLAADSPVAGNAYFITNDEPVLLWDLIDRMLACASLPPVKKTISARAAYRVGAILETLYKWTGRSDEPPMTRFVARQLSTAHWFNIAAARRDLGYRPQVNIDEGLKRLTEWLRKRA